MAARSRTSPKNSVSPGSARTGGSTGIEPKGLDRDGPLRIAEVTGVPAQTVSRVLARYDLPPLSWLEPITGESIRSSRATANRYEHQRLGELVHVYVKKLCRIPAGGVGAPSAETQPSPTSTRRPASASTVSTPSLTPRSPRLRRNP